MKKNSWIIKSKYNNAYLDLVSMYKDEGQRVLSTGLCFLNDKPIGNISVISDDFWSKPRKVQIPKKAIKYFLAHQIAFCMYSGKKIGLADKYVVDWLGVDERSVRSARKQQIKKHFERINCQSPLILCFDGNDGKQACILLLDNIQKDIHLPFNYSGRIYLWWKGEDDIKVMDGEIVVE